MKLHAICIAIALAGIAGTSVAGQPPAVGSTTTSAAKPRANPQLRIAWGRAAERLVGTYQSNAQVRKCGTTLPFMPVVNTISFHAGGTVTESARFPPAGAYNAFGIPGLFTRTIGLGTWWYDPSKRTYSMSLRFDYFIDGVYRGTGTVDRDLQISADGKTASGPVQASVYAADGSVIVDLCGDAVSARL